jgi:hypothetical protein
VTKACQLFLVPSRSSNPPLYPSKGCELGNVLRLLLFRCFLLGHLSPLRSCGCVSESTLWWPPLECHIVLLSRGVHVWMYSTLNFWKNFTIFLHIMLEYNLGKITILCTQKHKYTPKIIEMIFNIYESWRYIEPCHFTWFEPCLDIMWIIWKFSYQKVNFLSKNVVNVW